ncbi:MAG TPA: FKBP-type peptidyl-prolyl cis-trans isomerase [Solirubrobacterales bacterium]|nr:FKBP-type peptidyl-prolyl cis-trans isomerase [Solirubrobacterales bacterium]
MLILAACAALAVIAAGCGSDSSTSTTATNSPSPSGEETAGAAQSGAEAEKRTRPKVEVPKGPPPKELVTKDLIEGSGPEAKSGDEVTVQYAGVLYKTGKEFDASWNRGEPFSFTLGTGGVIPGWDQGVEGMKVGGRRELIIPPELAYGSQGVGPIPPESTLVFVIDLLSVN